MTPDWIPDTLAINPEWDQACSDLYSIFRNDFIDSAPQLRGHPVWIAKEVDENGYEEIFWHLITKEDRTSGDRLMDYPRAKKLSWCAPTILNSHQPEVTIWSYMEARRTVRVYLWLQECDYVVILEPSVKTGGTIFYLVTAYDTAGGSTHRNLRRKLENRLP